MRVWKPIPSILCILGFLLVIGSNPTRGVAYASAAPQARWQHTAPACLVEAVAALHSQSSVNSVDPLSNASPVTLYAPVHTYTLVSAIPVAAYALEFCLQTHSGLLVRLMVAASPCVLVLVAARSRCPSNDSEQKVLRPNCGQLNVRLGACTDC